MFEGRRLLQLLRDLSGLLPRRTYLLPIAALKVAFVLASEEAEEASLSVPKKT